MAAREVDDRKPAEAEPERAAKVIPFVVRPPVRDGTRHRLDVAGVDRLLSLKIVLTADAAHGCLARARASACATATGQHVPLAVRARRAAPGESRAAAPSRTAKASEHLRLRPAMHRNVVPSERAVASIETIRPASASGSAGRPAWSRSRSSSSGNRPRNSVAKIDALGVVVEFAPINGQARRARERLRQAALVEEMTHVVSDASVDRLRGSPRGPTSASILASALRTKQVWK